MSKYFNFKNNNNVSDCAVASYFVEALMVLDLLDESKLEETLRVLWG